MKENVSGCFFSEHSVDTVHCVCWWLGSGWTRNSTTATWSHVPTFQPTTFGLTIPRHPV